jgi:hypothetical protein
MSRSKSRREIASLARSHTQTIIRTLAGIMRQEKAPPMARIAAARILLDRGWGRVPQAPPMQDERPQITHIVETTIDPRPNAGTTPQQPGRALPNWDYDRYGDPDEPGWNERMLAEAEPIDMQPAEDE